MPFTEEGTLTIAPKDIPIRRHFFDAFGQYEAETSARWIVEYAQVRDQGWMPFAYEDLNKFYQVHFPHQNFQFNGLDGNDGKGSKYLTVVGGVLSPEHDTRVFCFTEAFIGNCYTSANRP